MTDRIDRRNLLRAGGAAVASSVLSPSTRVNAATDVSPIRGLWSVEVTASDAKYRYIYSFADGAYTATGDIDERFEDMKFSPTMGAFEQVAQGKLKYRERGWTYDLSGKATGTFESVGTFTLDKSGADFHGPGTYTISDLFGKITYRETFEAKGSKIDI